jgi:methylenetetrahydrofolate reductase (NADPH)
MSEGTAVMRGAGFPAISFEFFPPKDATQAAMLEATIARLAPFKPAYVSVTYGAGGSSQERSRGTVSQMMQRSLPTVAHVTCAGASCASLEATIARLRVMGVQRFVALRGDPPGGPTGQYRPHPAGFQDTSDLVRELKRQGATDVAVSAYPERHPQSPDWDCEIATLKRKVDAGADRAITQFFFDNDLYERYVERIKRAGIGIPVIPGIMPIHRFASVQTFAGRCGTTIPTHLSRRFESLDPESEAHRGAAAAVVLDQVSDLMRRGVQVFHLYTLNRAELSEIVCRSCGLLPNGARVAA